MPNIDISLNTLGIILAALAFGFYNGLHDSSNVVAPMISTRALRPRTALWMAALAIGVSPFIFGVAVATTIGRDIVADDSLNVTAMYAALLAAIGWNIITLKLGIPSSSSHALIGGLIGAVWAAEGLEAILWSGLTKVILALLLSPIIGLIAGYYAVKFVKFLGKRATPRINIWFQRGQIVVGLALALAHGTNDAQKTMGIMVLGLQATGNLDNFAIPDWVIIISALAMASGTLLGGWSLIKTLGMKFYRLRPIHGFGAQTAASSVILGAAMFGGPVSTTHVVSSSIVGAGSADRFQMVRWGVINNILLSWFFTIPATMGFSALLFQLFDLLE